MKYGRCNIRAQKIAIIKHIFADTDHGDLSKKLPLKESLSYVRTNETSNAVRYTKEFTVGIRISKVEQLSFVSISLECAEV
jgi:hypothetical protein